MKVPEMTRLATTLALLLVSQICLGAATSESGNKPLSAKNYEDWPNLVDAINDESRVFQLWVNGNESFYYRGGTHELNRVLKEFAETKYPELNVVILPGPQASKEFIKDKFQYDFRINIIGGITRAFVQRQKMEQVHSLIPTLTIYLTKEIQLDKIVIPDNVRLLQLYDLEARFEKAQQDENPLVKSGGAAALKALNEEFRRQGKDFEELEAQIDLIKKFVAKQNALRAKLKKP